MDPESPDAAMEAARMPRSCRGSAARAPATRRLPPKRAFPQAGPSVLSARVLPEQAPPPLQRGVGSDLPPVARAHPQQPVQGDLLRAVRGKESQIEGGAFG